MHSSKPSLRFARYLAGLAALAPCSLQVAHAAQDAKAPPRLPAVEDFVLPRTTEPAHTDTPSIDTEHHISSSQADALAASQEPEVSAEPDPAVPHHPSLTDRFFVGFGGYYATSNTSAQLLSSAGVGTVVDFEQTLGLADREWTPQGLARWRFSDNWRLELEYFSLHRNSSTNIDVQIDWGDQTFPIGTRIDSKFDIDDTRLSVGYSFFKRPDKEVGVAFGLHLASIDASLASSTGGQSQGGKVLAPLPVFSIYGQCAFTDRWALNARFDSFSLEYGAYGGSIFSSGVDVLYQPWRHIGFGLGYRSLIIDGSVDTGDWNGSINSTFQGPIAFVYASF